MANVKILFKLEKDENDYPPFTEENVWAKEIDKEKCLYQIDNIPFYVYGISLGDTVKIIHHPNHLQFKEIIKKSGNSTIRIYCQDTLAIKKIQQKLKKLGASFEGSNISSLMSVNIPKEIDLKSITTYLDKQMNKLNFEYEDGDIQHK